MRVQDGSVDAGSEGVERSAERSSEAAEVRRGHAAERRLSDRLSEPPTEKTQTRASGRSREAYQYQASKVVCLCSTARAGLGP